MPDYTAKNEELCRALRSRLAVADADRCARSRA